MRLNFNLRQLWPIKNILALFLLFLLSCMVSNVNAQEKTITGKIVSKDGTGLPGATVTVKGTTKGVITDVNGNFSISAASTDVLAVTYVGYVSQEIPVLAQSDIQVTLLEEVTNINEVVVTALGIKKDVKSIGYSTEEISGSDLTKARDVNAINGLVGKVAGLSIGASSEFLGTPTVVLRGNTDILYVVDGVPINSDTWNINADDVESYTVLKGPNAGALYGTRGLNGAILITTKKGTGVKGTSEIDFNSSDILDPKSFIAIPDRQDLYGLGKNYVYAYANDAYNHGSSNQRANVWGPRFNDGVEVAQFNSPVINGVRQKEPWLDLGKHNFTNFMEAGFHTSNNLSYNVTGEKGEARISLTDVYQKGIDPNTWLNSSTGNLFGGYNYNKRLRFEGNLNFNYQYSNNVPDAIYGPNSYTYMIQEYGSANYDITQFKNYWQSPNIPNVPSTGVPGVQQYWVEYGRTNNPYFMAYQWLRGHQKTDINGYGKISYDITPDLKVSVRAQASTYSLLRTETMPTSAITYSLNSGGIQEGNRTGEYREDRRNMWDNNNDILLTYNKNVTPDIFIGALGGANLRTFTYNSSWVSTNNIIIPSVYNFTNTANPLVAYNFLSNMTIFSLYYSVDFKYKNYFSINTTGRNDVSSVFASGYQSYFYPSVSASSVLTDYIKIPANIISYLKLRISYANVKGGLTSPTVGPSFEPLGIQSPLGYGSSYYSSYGGPTYSNQNGYALNYLYNNQLSADYTQTLANPALKPFTVSSTEFGGDFRFLNNKIGLGVTYYTTVNGPAIFPQQVAASTGYYSQNVNGITTTKNGLEIELMLNPITNLNGWSWVLTANYSTFTETLKSIYGSDNSVDLNDHYYHVGDRLDAIYAYKYFRDPSGNIINVVGSNGSASALTGPQGTQYKQRVGYANPDFTFGVTNRISYKNFSLSFQFDGRIGGTIYDEIYVDQFQSGNATDLVKGDLGTARANEWSQVKGTGTFSPVYNAPGDVLLTGTPTFDSNGNINNMKDLTFGPNNKAPIGVNAYTGTLNGYIQEPFFISRTYAMLREVTLTYNIPIKPGNTSFFKKASFSLVGRNLLYISVDKRHDTDLDQYPTGFDVSRIGQTKDQDDESNGYGTNNLNLIQDASMQTPVVRQFGFNVNLIF